mmetsp:Transcript_47648/g.137119  ORF Transcript_47648/g.137119 Transcript_47648/m.137119 type:complete len:313 (+) Transcript_47648:538-1476(+)
MVFLLQAQVALRRPDGLSPILRVVVILVLALVVRGRPKLFAKGATDLVDPPAEWRPVVALKLRVVEVVVLIRLPMVLPPAVPCSWGQAGMQKRPEVNKGRATKVQRRHQGIREVKQVLHWMHTEPAERFRIRVSVMEGVNILVDRPDMCEAVCEVEVVFPPHWDPKHDEKGRRKELRRRAKQLRVWYVRNLPCRVKTHHRALCQRPLQYSERPVPQIVGHVPRRRVAARSELPLGETSHIESPKKEAVVQERDARGHRKPLQHPIHRPARSCRIKVVRKAQVHCEADREPDQTRREEKDLKRHTRPEGLREP